MTDEQICRELAEFAGFESFKYTYAFAKYSESWQAPDKSPCEKPNFLDEIQGLGLLFKWVVPKLDYISIVRSKSGMGITYVGLMLGEIVETHEDKSPTRALALAVHKAIGGE